MTFDLNNKDFDLDTVQITDIKTFRDFGLLVNKIRLIFNKTRDRNVVAKFFDIIDYYSNNFPIEKKHYDYFRSCTHVDLSDNSNRTSNFMSAFKDSLSTLDKHEYAIFPLDFKFRALEAGFNFKENFKKSRFKKGYVSKKVFNQLVEKFWYFVEHAKNEQRTYPY